MNRKQIKVVLSGVVLAAAGFGCALVGAEPAEKPFKALVLPNTKKNVIAGDYNPQMKNLGITPVYVTNEQVADGSAFDLLADCEMMLVPPPFEGRMTNGAEKVRAWFEKGGMILMHDAVYQNRLKWLPDVDPKLALKGHGDCRYVKMTPVEPVSPLLTTPLKVEYGGYWGHMEFVSNAVWRPVVQCPHSNHCNMAVARLGKGVAYASAQWQGDTTPMIVNLRANAALVANDLALVESDVKEPVAGDNTFVAKVRNDGKAAQTVSLVYNGREKASEKIAAGETKEIVLKVRITERGPQHARVTLECAGLKAYVFDNDVRIKELFEVGSTRYRNLLSLGRRFEEIQFLSTVSPIEEKTEGAVARLEVVKDGQVLSTLDTPAVARGAMRAKAKFPKSLKPGVYTVRGTLVGADGKPLHVNESQVEIVEPYPGLACIDEDMNFIVDEEPFLPLGIYHVLPEQYDEASEMGVNTINMFGWEWSYGITTAFERGLRVVMQPWQFKDEEHFRVYGHNPGLFQWYVVDEPGDKDIPKSQLRNDTLHATDKLHPTYLCSCTPAKFDRFGVIADVFAPDPYPHTWDDPGIVGRWMDKAFEVCGDRNPLICIPQSHLMETHEEWLAMTHMALCHRSKGVFWYCWAQQGGGTLDVGIRNNVHRKDLPTLIGRFRAMEPALLNVAESDYFVQDGVHGMTCRDPELGTRYMIVVNPLTNGAPVSAKVAWKGAKKDVARAKEAFAAGEGFAMKDGVVDITLKPLEFHTLAIEGPVPAPVMLPPAPQKPQGAGVVRRVGPSAEFKTIQQAVDAAKPGDTILVAPGTYAPFATKNDFLTIRSEAGAEKTTIDAKGEGRCVTLTARPFANMYGETNTVVEGFTLTGGVADRTRLHKNRGGLALGGTLRNCVLTGGVAQYGGAAAYVRLEKCVLRGNRATKCGGAGAFVRAFDSTFEQNTSDFHGGAVFTSKIEGCRLVGNRARIYAGAMFYGDANRCVFEKNSCGESGGAVFTQDGLVRNSVFTANEAGVEGGGAWWSSVELSTFVGNKAPKGSGMTNGHYAEGCIFWQNDVSGIGRMSGTLVGVDPKFKPGTFVPSEDSPAVDFAGMTPRTADEPDLAGNLRLKGVRTDAGAYEAGAKPFKPFLASETKVFTLTPEMSNATVRLELPADKTIREITFRAKVRYAKDERKMGFGELASFVTDSGATASFGVYPGWPHAKGQVYGTVAYTCLVGSGKKEGEKRERIKETGKAKDALLTREQSHEIVFTVRAFGQDVSLSELVFDGKPGKPDHPWCEHHRQILELNSGTLTLKGRAALESLEISVR